MIFETLNSNQRVSSLLRLLFNKYISVGSLTRLSRLDHSVTWLTYLCIWFEDALCGYWQTSGEPRGLLEAPQWRVVWRGDGHTWGQMELVLPCRMWRLAYVWSMSLCLSPMMLKKLFISWPSASFPHCFSCVHGCYRKSQAQVVLSPLSKLSKTTWKIWLVQWTSTLQNIPIS